MTQLFLFLFIAAFPCVAIAQSQPPLQILVEELPEDARKCGFNEEVLRTPIVLTLRNNRINPTKSDSNPYLYINTNVLFDQNTGRCTYSVDVSIRHGQAAFSRNGFTAQNSERVILCGRGSLGYAHKSSVIKHLTDVIEQLTKECLATINY